MHCMWQVCILLLQDFFKKKGVAVMRVKELLDFVTDLTITDESVDDYLEKVCSCFAFEPRFPIFPTKSNIPITRNVYLMHRFKKGF